MSKLYVHADIRSLIKAMEQRLKQEAEQIADRKAKEFREELSTFCNHVAVEVHQRIDSDSADLVFVVPEKDRDPRKKEQES